MSRDKQIEEMANAIFEHCNAGLFYSEAKRIAHFVIEQQGYRKASEIFEEIESVLLDKDSPLTVWCAINGQKYAELKKKYTEGKAEIPPYVRMEAKALPATLNVKYTEE